MKGLVGERRWRLVRTRRGFQLLSLYSSMVWRPGRTAVFFCKHKHRFPMTYGRHQCGISIARSTAALQKQRTDANQLEGRAMIFPPILFEGENARGVAGIPIEFFIDGLPDDAIAFLSQWGVTLRTRLSPQFGEAS